MTTEMMEMTTGMLTVSFILTGTTRMFMNDLDTALISVFTFEMLVKIFWVR